MRSLHFPIINKPKPSPSPKEQELQSLPYSRGISKHVGMKSCIQLRRLSNTSKELEGRRVLRVGDVFKCIPI